MRIPQFEEIHRKLMLMSDVARQLDMTVKFVKSGSITSSLVYKLLFDLQRSINVPSVLYLDHFAFSELVTDDKTWPMIRVGLPAVSQAEDILEVDIKSPMTLNHTDVQVNFWGDIPGTTRSDKPFGINAAIRFGNGLRSGNYSIELAYKGSGDSTGNEVHIAAQPVDFEPSKYTDAGILFPQESGLISVVIVPLSLPGNPGRPAFNPQNYRPRKVNRWRRFLPKTNSDDRKSGVVQATAPTEDKLYPDLQDMESRMR